MDWRSRGSDATNQWFRNQQAIGGDGVEVEIDDTSIVRKKYGSGRVLNQILIFCSIERVSKQRFLIALTGYVGGETG